MEMTITLNKHLIAELCVRAISEKGLAPSDTSDLGAFKIEGETLLPTTELTFELKVHY